jgi:hypothetical protein
MKISDLEFEMELGGVDKADIADILKLYSNKTVNTDMIDDELSRRGYPKIFSVDYDSYEEEEEEDWDDDFFSVEKFPHKHRYE